MSQPVTRFMFASLDTAKSKGQSLYEAGYAVRIEPRDRRWLVAAQESDKPKLVIDTGFIDRPGGQRSERETAKVSKQTSAASLEIDDGEDEDEDEDVEWEGKEDEED